MEILLGCVVIAAVVAAVGWPFLRGPGAEEAAEGDRAELEIAKQNKYREIRDAELDYKAGKLDREQWDSVDGELRREAQAILAQLDSGGRTETGAWASKTL